MHMKENFQNFSKRDLPMESYLQQIHTLSSSLAAIGKPITDEELVIQTLNGLPASYSTFVTVMKNTRPFPTFLSIRPLLLSEEAHVESNITKENSTTTFTAVPAHTTSVGRGHQIRNPQMRGFSHSNANNGRGSSHNRGRHTYNFNHRNYSNSAPFLDGVLGRPPHPNK